MKYLIGINCGGTKTDFVAADSNLKIKYRGQAHACNLKKAGMESAVSVINDIMSEITTTAKIKTENILGICAGIAGAGRSEDAETLKYKVMEALESGFKITFPVIITTDAIITLEGAFNGKEGAVLISGTGSIIYAKDSKDIFYRAGGYGRVIGDEGSGYSIGRRGLAAAGKLFDSRGKDNLLAKMLKENFEVTTGEELIAKIYSHTFEPQDFAPFVIKAAEAKDEIAMNIIEEESDELVLHIKAIKNYFENKFNLCLSGGIIATDNYFSKMVKEKIKSRFPNVEIVKQAHPPETGAVLLLKKKIGM